MKIAFLSFYSGKIDRGVEVATAELAKRLNRHYDVVVFQAGGKITANVKTVVLDTQKTWPGDSSSSPWRHFYIDYYSRKILAFTVAFLPFFKREKYDVVVPTNGGWQVVLVKIFCKLYGKKLVVQGNAGIGRDDLWQLFWRPDHFIAISPQGYAWIKTKTSTIPVTYIPHGVDTKLFARIRPKTVPLSRPIILCVSALLPYKRVELLIKAIALIPEVSLLLIGHGPLEKEIANRGQILLKDRFLLLTNITHDQLISYYKVADLFSLPSKSSEALGIVYIEAMAAGLGIVAPNDSHRREIIGDAGLFVDPENTAAYAQTIRKSLKIKFKNKALQQAKKYDWEIIVQQYQKVLSNL